jgi:prophage regulatory protein
MRTNEPSKPVQATHGASPATHDARVTITAAKPGKLLRLPSVEDLTGLRKSTIYAGVNANTFPAPVRLSARAVAWREDEICRWILERTTTKSHEPKAVGSTPEH